MNNKIKTLILLSTLSLSSGANAALGNFFSGVVIGKPCSSLSATSTTAKGEVVYCKEDAKKNKVWTAAMSGTKYIDNATGKQIAEGHIVSTTKTWKGAVTLRGGYTCASDVAANHGTLKLEARVKNGTLEMRSTLTTKPLKYSWTTTTTSGRGVNKKTTTTTHYSPLLLGKYNHSSGWVSNSYLKHYQNLLI